jgi:hypothetical protein
MTDALEPTMTEVVVGELRNHATRRSGSRVFRTSLEARSEVEKKTALVDFNRKHTACGERGATLLDKMLPCLFNVCQDSVPSSTLCN